MIITVAGSLGSIDVCLDKDVLIKACFCELRVLVSVGATIDFANSEAKTALVIGSENTGEFDNLSFSKSTGNLQVFTERGLNVFLACCRF